MTAALRGPGVGEPTGPPVVGAPSTALTLRGRVVRTRWCSARYDPRTLAVSVALLATTGAVVCWSMAVGDFPVPVGEVIRSVLGTGSEDAEFVVWTLRLPRAVTGVLVGAAFGMSGAVFQSLTRNPLGSPDVVGFESGAALGAVVAIVVFDGSTAEVALGAVAGGIATSLLVYVLAWRRGLSSGRLVLVGIGIGFAAIAAVDYLITRAQIYDVQRAAVWLTGSLNNRGWDDVRVVGLGLLVLAPLVVSAQRSLDRLELGDDTAAALGVRVGRTKLVLVVVAVALASLAVAAAGPIVFVAFVAGPIARRLVGSPGACVVPAALVGAMLTTGADLAARRAFAPVEIPVGIATAVIGAPYLLWLLARRSRTGQL